MDDIKPRSPQRASKRNQSWKKWLIVAGFFMGVIVVAVIVYAQVVNTPKDGESEMKQIVERVGELMLLPQDEEPALVTVTDKEKVKDPFLSKGENGDKVLVYSKAKRVIIYRPKINKIVDVGPVSIVPLQPGANQ